MLHTRLYQSIALVISLFCLAYADDESLAVLPSDGDYGQPIYSQTIFQSYEFAESWGKPAVYAYSPPANVNFNRVVFEMHVGTTGTNYDRIGFIKLDEIEVWRTSTPEPDGRGNNWSVEKDVSYYLPVFQGNHQLQMYIDNNVEGSLDGTFYVNLTLNFYSSNAPMNTADGWAVDLSDAATSVQALAAPGNAVAWSAPSDDISSSLSVGSNVDRALLHVLASGNGDDEFWWDTNNGNVGPSRFIDVFVNGQMAGFAAPFPTIFTGGVSPYLWRPIVGLRAFDVPGYFIDITPFLPELWKGATISANVTNGLDDTQIPDNWYININLLTWQGSGSNSGSTSAPQFTTQKSAGSYSAGANVVISRNLTTSATLNINGQSQNVQWTQEVDYQNDPTSSQNGNNNYVYQDSTGTDSISGLSKSFSRKYDYPIQATIDKDYFNIQASYDVTAGGYYFESWVDSSVWLNTGNFAYSNSTEYLSGPVHAHYAEAINQQIVVEW